jgi:hypothetical protein
MVLVLMGLPDPEFTKYSRSLSLGKFPLPRLSMAATKSINVFSRLQLR